MVQKPDDGHYRPKHVVSLNLSKYQLSAQFF